MTGGEDSEEVKAVSAGTGTSSKERREKENIWVIDMVTNMFSTMDSNDLESLKKFLDSKESRIDQYTNAVEYSYQVVPQIYAQDGEKVRQVHPLFRGGRAWFVCRLKQSDVFDDEYRRLLSDAGRFRSV